MINEKNSLNEQKPEKKEKNLSQVLKSAFDHLALIAQLTTKEPIVWQDFKVVMVSINHLKIGIGINNDYSTLKIFNIIDNNKQNDADNLQETFSIDVKQNDSKTAFWDLKMNLNQFNTGTDDLSLVVDRLKSTTEIIKFIKQMEDL